MKKYAILACISISIFGFSTYHIHAQEAPSGGYSLEDALGDSLKNTTEQRDDNAAATNLRTQEAREQRPVHLIGTDAKLRGDTSDITTYLQRFANGIITIAGVLTVLILLWNGKNMILSLGDPDAITNAKKGITWSLLGLLVMMMAFVVVRTAINFTYIADGPANDYRGLAVADSLDLCIAESAEIITENVTNLQTIDTNVESMYIFKEEAELNLQEQEYYYLNGNDTGTTIQSIKKNKQNEAQELLRDTQKQVTDITTFIASNERDHSTIYNQLSKTLLNCGTYKETNEVEILSNYTGRIEDVENRFTDAEAALEKAQENTQDLFDLPTVDPK